MARGKNREIELGSKTNSGSRSALRRNKPTNHTADYGAIDGNLIRQAIEGITVRGGAVRFGYTSDGGAYALGIYDGDDKWTEYCRSDEELRDYLQFLAEGGSDQ